MKQSYKSVQIRLPAEIFERFAALVPEGFYTHVFRNLIEACLAANEEPKTGKLFQGALLTGKIKVTPDL